MTITKRGIFVADEKPKEETFNYAYLGHCLLDKLHNSNANELIIVDVASGRQWKGAELCEKILNVATALIDKHQFEPGTVACISYDHSDYNCILAMGIIFAGGIVANAFPLDPYAEVLYQAERDEPKFLFCRRENSSWAKQLSLDLGYPVKTILMDGKPGELAEFDYFHELLNYDHRQSAARQLVPVACKDPSVEVCIVTMSSGTTGRPKAVPATHSKCLEDVSGFTGRNLTGFRFASIASLDYVSGRLILFGSFCYGYTSIIMNGFEPESCLQILEKYKINAIYLGAASFYQLITNKNVNNYDLSSLKICFPMGAKIVYLEELKSFFERHPNIKIVKQGYGTSEFCGAAMKNMTPAEYLKDCDNCGRLLPGVQAKIVCTKTGELLGPNQVGALHILNRNKFLGYYDARLLKQKLQSKENNNIRNPSVFLQDESVFDEDGFYITGDLAYFNQKEELYLVGREKELMSCRGAKKVVPQELEELLKEHPAVSKVCVFSVPNQRELTLHCPRAFIIPKAKYYDNKEPFEPTKRLETLTSLTQPEQILTHTGTHTLCKLEANKRRQMAEDMMRFVNERVGWEKQLTGGIVLLDEIPTMRASGKMNKTYLRSLTTDQVEIFGDLSRLSE